MAYYEDINQLMYLIGKQIRINDKKYGACFGILLGIQRDYLVVQTHNNHVFYYRSQYISKLSEARRGVLPVGYHKDIRVVMTFDFLHLLRSFHNRILLVNLGGPHQLTGVVVGVEKDELIMEIGGNMIKLSINEIWYAEHKP